VRALAKILAAGLLAGAAPAFAGPTVSLNGVSIEGLTNQRFENCVVTIDAQGNVNIEAKGYAAKPVVEPASPGAPAAAAERVTRRYFLSTEQTEPGATQYDIGVFINGRWVRELKSADPKAVFEVTRFLRPGANKVVLAATKRIGDERASSSPDAVYRVVIGEGTVSGDRISIQKPLVEMTRNAAETQDLSEEYELAAR
jgi:hypothetical protein